MVYVYDPFEQFEVFWSTSLFKCPYYRLRIGYGGLSRILSSYTFILFFLLVHSQKIIKTNKINFLFVSIFDFVSTILKFSIELKRYFIFPLFFMIFLFILINNLLGLLPFVSTLTSHFVVTLYLSTSIFLGNTIIGACLHRQQFFGLFLPEGVPNFIMPLLVIIEFVSYGSRMFSLAIRLFANMLAGHVLLKILISFIFDFPFSLKILPLTLIFAIILLEFVIGFLQSYVFLVLITAYLNDAVYLH